MANKKMSGIRRAALAALAFFIVLAAPALASSDGTVTYRAMLIGNSNFSDVDLSDLPSCAYDVSNMAAALQSGSIHFDVDARNNQTRDQIESAVFDMVSWGADDDDVSVFYYTGHGSSSGVAGVDYDNGSNVYSFSLLQSTLSGVPGTVIVLLDSCESGGLIAKSTASAGSFTDNAIAAFKVANRSGVVSKAITSGTKFHVIASSSQTQESFAAARFGLATNALCEAMGWQHSGSTAAGNKLPSLEGDANGDYTVTVGEAYTYASGVVSEQIAEQNKTGTDYEQDMQIYPVGSAQTLIARDATIDASLIETSKATESSMNLSKACIAPGRTLQLSCGSDDAFWTTSRSALATVDSDTGLVTGKKYSYSAFATITATYYKDSTPYVAYCQVRVLPLRYVVQSLRFKKTALTLEQGSSYKMPTAIYPASARYKKLRWKSSDSTAVTVSSTGVITAVKKDGSTATITATATSGVTATCVVTTTPATPRSVTLDKKKLTLIPGGKYMLTETVYPAIAENRNVIWASSNTDVATVNTDGQVIALSTGKTVISATTEVNGRRATCTVYVVPNESRPNVRPRSAYGRLTTSAKRIYYKDDNATLCVVMWYYNRTGSTQRVPLTEKSVIMLKLKDGSRPYAVYTATVRKSLRNRYYTTYTFEFSTTENEQFANLDLRGSTAICEPQ